MIIALILLGKFLEARSLGKTGEAVKKLLDMTPKTATLWTEEGEKILPVEEIRAGDLLILKAGERVAVDGVVVSGHASVDESMLTGESVPVDKKEGDPVFAGTINKASVAKYRAERVGSETALSEIIRMVENAQGSKAPIAKLADKIAGIFTPVVIGIALLAFAVWMLIGKDFEFAINIFVSVLVVACPCALGLATPTAIIAGTGKGAEKGILFKSAAALQTLSKTNRIVFDKTGTITTGNVRVQEVRALGTLSERDALFYVSSAELHSVHPLAKAVVDYALESGITPEEPEKTEIIDGFGLISVVRDRTVRVGKPSKEEQKSVINDGGFTLVTAEVDGVPVLRLSLTDALKEDAAETMEGLNGLGIETYLLSGDNRAAVGRVAERAGIRNVIAEVLPEEKAAKVAELRKDGNVTMVGDGVNDAPALATADTGIAVSNGTDVAIEVADIVITSHKLRSVLTAVRLSRKTMRVVKQNLFWAFIYNCIGIPVACGVFAGAGLLLNPMIAAAAMTLSSVCVVSNALRLNLFRDTEERHNAAEKTEVLTKKEEDPMEKIVLNVEGMMCSHCENRVETALKELSGVADCKADHTAKRVEVTFDPSKVQAEQMKEAVIRQGYEVK